MVCQIFMEKATKPYGRGKEIKDLLYSWMEGFGVLKTVIFPKLTYKFNTTSIKITVEFFKELDKKMLKNCKEEGGGEAEEEKEKGTILLHIGTDYKVLVVI